MEPSADDRAIPQRADRVAVGSFASQSVQPYSTIFGAARVSWVQLQNHRLHLDRDAARHGELRGGLPLSSDSRPSSN